MNYKLLFPIDLKGFLGKQDDSTNSNVLTLRVEGAKAATEEIQAKRVATFIFNLFSKKQKIEIVCRLFRLCFFSERRIIFDLKYYEHVP